MELSKVFWELLTIYWYFIPLIVGLVIIKSPWFKGVLGEFLVNISSKLLLSRKKGYHLIKNITLPTEKGTTQIDHILVSRYGVFVVETKNMKGWIFGKPLEQNWTQKLYKQSFRFQNPRLQNYKHIKTLGNIINVNERYIFSVVAFVGSSVFKTPMPEDVTSGFGYIRYIKSKQAIVLSDDEVQSTLQAIKQHRLANTWRVMQAHKQHVKEIKQQASRRKICSQCGYAMEKRTARKGKFQGQVFWGCTQFPKCKNIVGIK